MKKQLIVGGLMMLALCNFAHATLFSYNFTNGFSTTDIPDANPSGWADSHSVSGITTPQITDVSVRLNISGGYNGDLYGYLRLTDENNNTLLAVLLNRVGQGTGSEPVTSFGYADAGLNITLNSAGANGNIHNYQDVSGFGTKISDGSSWQPDGGDMTAFNGKSANGTWTLFLADLSGSDISQMASWGLDISVVPEPTTWAIIIFAVVVAGHITVRRFRRQQA